MTFTAPSILQLFLRSIFSPLLTDKVRAMLEVKIVAGTQWDYFGLYYVLFGNLVIMYRIGYRNSNLEHTGCPKKKNAI